MPVIWELDVPREAKEPQEPLDVGLMLLGGLLQFVAWTGIWLFWSIYTLVLGLVAVMSWGLVGTSVRRYIAPLKVSGTRPGRLPRIEIGVFHREDR